MSEKIVQFVIFKLGQQELGLDVLKVQEIIRPLPITKLPQSPDYMLGIINLREEIIPVIDLKQFFQMESREETEETKVIVIKQNRSTVGIIVDEVREVLRISTEKIKASDDLEHNLKKDYIEGVAKLKDRMIVLLDLTTLIQ